MATQQQLQQQQQQQREGVCSTFAAYQVGSTVHYNSFVYGEDQQIRVISERMRSESESEGPALKAVNWATSVAAPSRRVRVERLLPKRTTRLGAGRRNRNQSLSYPWSEDSAGESGAEDIPTARQLYFKLLAPEHRTPLSEIFNDDEARAALEPFINCTYDEQEAMLRQLTAAKKTAKGKRKRPRQSGSGAGKGAAASPKGATTTGDSCWSAIPRSGRKLLLQLHGHPLLHSIDQDICQWLATNHQNQHQNQQQQQQTGKPNLELTFDCVLGSFLSELLSCYYALRYHWCRLEEPEGHYSAEFRAIPDKTHLKYPRAAAAHIQLLLAHSEDYFSDGTPLRTAQTQARQKLYRKSRKENTPPPPTTSIPP